MLVYGDHWRVFRPEDRLAELGRALADGEPEHLTRALIDAGELAQALADAETAGSGIDDVTPLQCAAMELCTSLARRRFCKAGDGDAELATLARRPLPAEVRGKLAEGYAFYGVTPEAYAAAARAHAWASPPLVIGLRSIGTSLAATVAAVTGGRAISLRPRGHPFDRTIVASDRLKSRLRDHSGPFAIVDEGPGLSGSSFGAVADLLEALGVAPERVVFMPSHDGEPGPQASPRHRVRWGAVTKVHRTLDDLLAEAPIAEMFADLIGEAVRVEDLSGGAWRRDLPEPLWPPVFPGQERRKFRLTSRHGVFLARFAGLGGVGEEKFETAARLAGAGYTAEPLAFRHGFLLERWLGGQPWRAGPPPGLADYLAFRARELPAGDRAGANHRALREMAAHNATELCGAEAGLQLGERLEALFAAAAAPRPIRIDGRLHAWEWRRTPGGRVVKTDALDHAEAHDLIGPQDVAWDIAGAAVEFGLSDAETARLARAVGEASGARVDPASVEVMGICYAAFQGGLWSLAETQSDPREAARIRAHRRRYAAHLETAAGVTDPAVRRRARA
ncbi:hypothetical protein [Phenylobacterium sp.]|jgi:hypothetical protein|uniref:hypothetical protein n=1 Tax=Phenylobacterium sp. TaxID=1871053 RepID=UPI0037849259